MPRGAAFCLAATLAVVGPACALAEELGKITAFLDGNRRTWHTITFRQGEGDIATATFRQSGHLAELQFQGHPVPKFTSKDVLNIDVRFRGLYEPGAAPMSVDILYTPSGLSGPLWTSRGAPEPVEVQVLSFEIWGSFGQVTAIFSGQVCKRPRLFSKTDTTDCMRLNGLVETRLEVQ